MVSVIIPAYNTEKYIERCLKSIIDQEYKKLEIIVINDGSTDRTLSICKEIALGDERIQIIDIDNSGVSKARNEGLRLAKGKYVCFIDADDYIEKDYIKKYINVMNQTQADIVIGGVIEERESKKILKRNSNLILEGKECEKLICSLLDNTTDDLNSFNAQTLGFPFAKLYKKDKIKNITFPENIPIREDALFNAKVLLNINKVALSDLTGYHYIVNDKSATGKYRKNYTDEAKLFLMECKKIWEDNNLCTNSLYIGYLYTYMRWMKMYVMHIKSKHTFFNQIALIKDSFKENIWNEGFHKVNKKSLNIQYRCLRAMFKKCRYIEIYILCKISNILKR